MARVTVARPLSVDSAGWEQQDAYAISAEFYDLLQAERDESRVRAFYRADVGRARVGVLDVGAGTGRVTLMSLFESWVPVHAVEPARSMRIPLMTTGCAVRGVCCADTTKRSGCGRRPAGR